MTLAEGIFVSKAVVFLYFLKISPLFAYEAKLLFVSGATDESLSPTIASLSPTPLLNTGP